MNWLHAQSGTLATDYYRESKGQQAMNTLDAGRSTTTKSGDHLSANELCIETISRLHFDNTKVVSDAAVVNNVINAVNNLRLGNGYHKKQSDHSGGNTCAAVIAAATG